MSITQSDLDRFHQFATTRLNSGEAESLYELVDEWECEQLSPDELKRNAAAIQSAIDEMEAGDTGRSARDVIAAARHRHNIPDA